MEENKIQSKIKINIDIGIKKYIYRYIFVDCMFASSHTIFTHVVRKCLLLTSFVIYIIIFNI